MRSTFSVAAFVAACVYFSGGALAQQTWDGLWTELKGSELESYRSARASLLPNVQPQVFRTFHLNEAAFAASVAKAPTEQLDVDPLLRPAPAEITIPMPDGTFARFAYVESPVMAAELAERFPDIRTWVGQGLDDPSATIRFDKTPQGFHAQILSPNGAVYIDPYYDNTAYAVYRKADFVPIGKEFVCASLEHPSDPGVRESPQILNRSGSQLRTYRLAMACTGEYAAFHGGTTAGALAAIVTTVNRVNGIYETELAIRMTLIANNDDIIFLNAGSDPYSNSDGVAMLSQNQTTIDSIIGSTNYDIGHVVSTGGGGVAYLRSVCQSFKAGGVTGSSAPVGDPFDVDYVSHEVGHQFGGDHTFNSTTGSCSGGNRTAASAYEPGSGSTIQAYAGICGADNLQPNSDPYFHSRSFDQMIAFSVSTTCGVTTSTGNTVPTANAGSNYTIPKGTPFTLTGSGSDGDNDPLTFCWEQRDLGPAAGLAAADDGQIPLFRSLNPTASPTRTFPKMSTLLANTTDFAEKLPQLSRAMDFRITVRDNRVGGGGVDTDDMVVNVDATKGPFIVTFPNGGESVSDDITVTWNVANTNASPVNTSEVDILLSIDGGDSFDTVLANNTPNDGSQTVTLPDASTSEARIMVRAEGNIFFDISNANFSISAPGSETQTFNSTDVPKVIESASPNTITSTLNVPESLEIVDINVALNISHTYVSDLIVSLTSAEGTTITLINDVGGAGDNFTNTILDDEAPTAIEAGSAPFTGSFRPASPLSAFDTQDAQGTWTLTVQDIFSADGGFLNAWSVTITPASTPVLKDTVYVDFGWNGTESGTQVQPYNTLAEGLGAVADGGTVWLDPGVSNETGTVDQNVRIRITGAGLAVIGSLP